MDLFACNNNDRTRTTRFRAHVEKEDRFGEKSIAIAQAGISISFLLLHLTACVFSGKCIQGSFITIVLVTLLLLSAARYFASQDSVLKNNMFNILTILDGISILILIVAYIAIYDSSHGVRLTAAPVLLMFVFVGLRALQSDPVQVVLAGSTIILGLIITIALVSGFAKEDVIQGIIFQQQSGFSITLSSIIENIISLAVLTAVISIGVVRCRRLLSNSTHMDDLREERDKVKALSSTDSLTELVNRAEFSNRLDKSIRALADNSKQLAVMILDLDRFKSINDMIGHPAGDQFLQELGKRLKASVRETDLVARLGGDEFAILLEGVKDVESIERLSDRLTREISRTLLTMDSDLQIETSVGISLAPQDGNNAEQLMGNAEIALAKSKEKGRGYCTLFQEDFRTNLQHENALEIDLREALKKNQLIVFFQPKYNIKSGSVDSVEALIRWQHPEKGMISPDEFIPAAERSGLIIDIGQFVLGRTCDFIQRAERENLNINRVAINVAAREFMSDNRFFDNLMRTVRARGVSPNKIELEITEQVLLDQRSDYVFDIFDRLMSEGVHISLDDFGTGYASLIHLSKCPINAIKLDRSFIAGINTNKRETAIVSAITRMAKELDLEITAEGVETLEQFEFVRHSKCDFVQGYYVARPLQEDHLIDFLKYHNSRQYRIAG